jgi:hypothetical protein
MEHRGPKSALNDYGRPRIKIRPDRFANHGAAARPMWLTSTKQARGGSALDKNFGFAKKEKIALKHGQNRRSCQAVDLKRQIKIQ